MKRLLVVDDEPGVRETIAFILKMEGYEVLTATDGPSALLALERTPFDAVLLDLMMPAMDGYEVCRRIREEERHAALPLLILTARWKRDELDRALAAGATALFKKPLDEASLLACLQAHLG